MWFLQDAKMESATNKAPRCKDGERILSRAAGGGGARLTQAAHNSDSESIAPVDRNAPLEIQGLRIIRA